MITFKLETTKDGYFFDIRIIKLYRNLDAKEL